MLSAAQVNALANDMRKGLWRPSHQGIAFDEEGNLLDGQHRLAAIVESGVAVTLTVAIGVPSSSLTVLDVGRKRTVADMLAIEGLKNPNVLASIARLGLLYDQKDFSAKGIKSVSAPQVHAYAVENIGPLIQAAYRTGTLRNQIPATTAVSGTAFYLFNRVDPESCEQFFNAMAHMRTDGEGDPRLALYRRLSSIRSERQQVPSSLHVLDLFIRAWNLWRANDEIVKLPMATRLLWREIR